MNYFLVITASGMTSLFVSGICLMNLLTGYCCLMQDVPPLDIPELLAHLVKQSWPLFDHLGIRRGKKKLHISFLSLSDS